MRQKFARAWTDLCAAGGGETGQRLRSDRVSVPVAPGSRLGGTVTLQIWIAVSVYVLVAIKKRHGLSASKALK